MSSQTIIYLTLSDSVSTVLEVIITTGCANSQFDTYLFAIKFNICLKFEMSTTDLITLST